MVDNGLAEAAGRSAYLAAFHAAQAVIFEVSGKIAKTHTGVRSEFAPLAKEDPRLDRSLATFLARAYVLKTTADYGMGDEACLTETEARTAIEEARRYVEGVALALTGPTQAGS